MNAAQLARKIALLLALANCPSAAAGEAANARSAAAKLYRQLHGQEAPWARQSAPKAESKAKADGSKAPKAKPASKAPKARKASAPKAKADPSKAPEGKPVWVNGYTRKDGRVVNGYWRSAPKAR